MRERWKTKRNKRECIGIRGDLIGFFVYRTVGDEHEDEETGVSGKEQGRERWVEERREEKRTVIRRPPRNQRLAGPGCWVELQAREHKPEGQGQLE